MKMNKKQKAAQITNLLLGTIMPVEEMVNAYFAHDSEAFIKVIAANSKNSTDMINALAKASYEIEKDDVLNGNSIYGDIQAEIINQMAKPDNLEFFRTHSIFNEEIIGGACPDLEAANMLISGIEQNSRGFEKTKAA